MKRKIPKIVSRIVATIAFILIGWYLLPDFWFWVSFEFVALLLVAIGCGGEWWLHHHPAGKMKQSKDEHHRIESRFIAAVAIGVGMELFSLVHSVREGVKLEKEVALAKEQVANAESNLEVLNKSTIELAHQYDLSTNALAEAKARLENQIVEAKTKIAKDDPRNLPIRTLTAQVFIKMLGTNFFDNDLPPTDEYFLKAGVFSIEGKNGRKIASMHCKTTDCSILVGSPESGNKRIGRSFSMNFSWKEDLFEWESNESIPTNIPPEIRNIIKDDWIVRNNASLNKLDEEMAGIEILVPGVGVGNKIASSSCILTFNGSIQRSFKMPDNTDSVLLFCPKMADSP